MMLDSRIAEERMIALDPAFAAPDWLHEVMGENWMPHAILMDAAGGVALRRVLIDEVFWADVVAFRMETPSGAPLERADFEPDPFAWFGEDTD